MLLVNTLSEGCRKFSLFHKNVLKASAKMSIEKGEKIAVFVGPEGGFSLDEVALAKSFGAASVNLGPRILRCETAPLYALSAISYHFEI